MRPSAIGNSPTFIKNSPTMYSQTHSLLYRECVRRAIFFFISVAIALVFILLYSLCCLCWLNLIGYLRAWYRALSRRGIFRLCFCKFYFRCRKFFLDCFLFREQSICDTIETQDVQVVTDETIGHLVQATKQHNELVEYDSRVGHATLELLPDSFACT